MAICRTRSPPPPGLPPALSLFFPPALPPPPPARESRRRGVLLSPPPPPSPLAAAAGLGSLGGRSAPPRGLLLPPRPPRAALSFSLFFLLLSRGTSPAAEGADARAGGSAALPSLPPPDLGFGAMMRTMPGATASGGDVSVLEAVARVPRAFRAFPASAARPSVSHEVSATRARASAVAPAAASAPLCRSLDAFALSFVFSFAGFCDEDAVVSD